MFFQTRNQLLPEVTAPAGVYEWETDGEGSCESESQDGGCLSLISGNGHGLEQFGDASANGDDVFFFTEAPLSENDVDNNNDVYDAQVDGGEPPAPECKPPDVLDPLARRCVKEECDTAETCRLEKRQPPVNSFPASAFFNGPGNLVASVEKGKEPEKRVTKSLTRAQKLALALKVCRAKDRGKKERHKREVCEKAARGRYGSVKKPRKK